MLIKKKDPRTKDIEELKFLLKDENLTPEQHLQITTELKKLTSGEQGEYNSAYFIDFYYTSSKNTAIIHDLRIECNGQVAQIDHLLVNRMYHFDVIESKNYSSQVTINANGEFQIFDEYKQKYIGIDSPIEQTKRHIKILEEFLKQEDILPKKLGIPVKPTFGNFVLFSPRSVIERPNPRNFNTDIIVKADAFKSVRDKLIDREAEQIGNFVGNIMGIAKFVSTPEEEIKEFAQKLASYHKPPKPFNYRKKFGITLVNEFKNIQKPEPETKAKPKPKPKPKLKNEKGIT